MEKLSHVLNTPAGETTTDWRFSLETVRCLGACGLAPVMVVDDQTYKQMNSSDVQEILSEYE